MLVSEEWCDRVSGQEGCCTSAALTREQKAMSATDGASQAELRREHAATQVSGCRVCPAPMPGLKGSSEHTCGRCASGEELLSLVVELREEVSRLRIVRESEEETDYWNCTLLSLGQACQADRTHDTENLLSSLPAGGGDLRDRGRRGRMVASSCLTQQAHLVHDYLTFLGALVQ